MKIQKKRKFTQLSFIQLYKKHKVMFGYWKILRKEKKNIKENNFFMFDCHMKNIKENQI